MSEQQRDALSKCHRDGCGHPIGTHSGSEWGEKCSECPCPDYWSGTYPLHDCDEDGTCAPDCRTCSKAEGGPSCTGCGGEIFSLSEACASGGSCDRACAACGAHYPPGRPAMRSEAEGGQP